MKKLRNNISNYHEIAFEEARRMRMARIEGQKDPKACPDVEIEWLKDFIQVELELAKKALERWGTVKKKRRREAN